jgi:hypothetical protein
LRSAGLVALRSRRRFVRPQTLVSFGIAAAILLFFLWQLEIATGEVWSSSAHPGDYL